MLLQAPQFDGCAVNLETASQLHCRTRLHLTLLFSRSINQSTESRYPQLRNRHTSQRNSKPNRSLAPHRASPRVSRIEFSVAYGL
jgi:hypothetical protein